MQLISFSIESSEKGTYFQSLVSLQKPALHERPLHFFKGPLYPGCVWTFTVHLHTQSSWILSLFHGTDINHIKCFLLSPHSRDDKHLGSA